MKYSKNRIPKRRGAGRWRKLRVKPEKYRKIKEPLAPLYKMAAGGAACFLKTLCGLRVERAGDIPASGPLLVLCSHQGMTDFAVTAAALLPRRLHFVCSENFFRKPLLAPVLHAMGVIPKVQFSADPRCIASILRTLKGGGAVCVYPAGQTSMVGRPGEIGRAIARLVKKSGANVAALRLHGGFFTRSRFAKGLNRGRIDARLSLLFTPEQLKTLTDDEVYDGVCAAIDYDEYRWQKETGAQFRSRHRARGYQNMLCVCPRCGAHWTWRDRGNRVFCTQCGNAGAVGRDMRLHAEQGAVLPETLPQWLDMLRRGWEKRLLDGEFAMKSHALCRRWDGRRFAPDGGGEIALDEHSFCYTPHSGETVCVKNETLPAMRCVPGAYLELEAGAQGTLRFYPDEGRSVTEWKLAQEYLHERAERQKKVRCDRVDSD